MARLRKQVDMTNAAAPPERPAEPPGMPIQACTVDRYGTITGDRGTRIVPRDPQPLPIVPDSEYPPCEYPRCHPAVMDR